MYHDPMDFFEKWCIEIFGIIANPFYTDKNIADYMATIFSVIKSYYISITVVMEVFYIEVQEKSITAKNVI